MGLPQGGSLYLRLLITWCWKVGIAGEKGRKVVWSAELAWLCPLPKYRRSFLQPCCWMKLLLPTLPRLFKFSWPRDWSKEGKISRWRFREGGGGKRRSEVACLGCSTSWNRKGRKGGRLWEKELVLFLLFLVHWRCLPVILSQYLFLVLIHQISNFYHGVGGWD